MNELTFLFDLDGVLIDTKDLHQLAMIEAFRKFDILIEQEEHNFLLEGLPTKEKIERVNTFKNLKLDQNFKELIYKEKQRLTYDYLKDFNFESDQVCKVLEYIKGKNFKIGLCSNTIRPTLNMIVNKLKIADFFEVTLSSEDVAHAKPEPEIYLSAMQKLETNFQNTIIFEDSEVGLAAAYASKAHTIKVNSSRDICINLIKEAESRFFVGGQI